MKPGLSTPAAWHPGSQTFTTAPTPEKINRAPESPTLRDCEKGTQWTTPHKAGIYLYALCFYELPSQIPPVARGGHLEFLHWPRQPPQCEHQQNEVHSQDSPSVQQMWCFWSWPPGTSAARGCRSPDGAGWVRLPAQGTAPTHLRHAACRDGAAPTWGKNAAQPRVVR